MSYFGIITNLSLKLSSGTFRLLKFETRKASWKIFVYVSTRQNVFYIGPGFRKRSPPPPPNQCFFYNLQSFLGSYKKILDFFVQRTKKKIDTFHAFSY